jgi:hypothetical protein
VIDENAFGILIAHYDLENIEYSLEESAYLEYLSRFVAVVDERLTSKPVAAGLRRLDLGHAYYFEFADGDQLENPITWIRELRSALVDADLPNICVLSAGGRWVTPAEGNTNEDASAGTSPAAVAYGPSEPLRKAFAAEALSQPTEAGEEGETGWGPGLYIEKEAIEQSGRTLKNAPTALFVHSSVFYRIGA